MTKDEALKHLRDLQSSGDQESAHCEAGEVLLALIGDVEIREAYNRIPKWYA